MPVQSCASGGKSGFKWGQGGKCFTGPGGRAKAAKQGRAIKARQGATMQEFDEMLGRYTVTDNEDGTKNILAVPIFDLDEFETENGRPYDKKWFERAKARHKELKEDEDYLPTFHPGHTSDNLPEPPAYGLIDNLVLKGKRVIADLTKIGKKAWAEIKDGNWPYRSVEILNSPEEARILSLALLGASPPAVKTPPLYAYEHFSGDTKDVDVFTCKYHKAILMDMFLEAVAGGLTFDQLSSKIQDKVKEQVEQNSNNTTSTGLLEEAHVWVKTIFVDTPIAIIDFDSELFSITYSIGQDNSVSVTDMIKVEEQYVPIVMAQFSDGNVDEKKLNKMKEDILMTEAEKKAADEKAIADKVKADKLAEEKAEADKLAKEKAEADKEAADKLKDKIDKNESDKMADEIKGLKDEMAELKGDVVKAKEDKVTAEVDAFIDKHNSAGILPKSLIEFKGEKNGLALRETMLKATPEVRADIMEFVEAIPQAVNFKEVAPNGDEEDKENAGSPEKLGEKLAKLSEAMADEKKIDIKDAQIIVCNENPDLQKYVETMFG